MCVLQRVKQVAKAPLGRQLSETDATRRRGTYAHLTNSWDICPRPCSLGEQLVIP